MLIFGEKFYGLGEIINAVVVEIPSDVECTFMGYRAFADVAEESFTGEEAVGPSGQNFIGDCFFAEDSQRGVASLRAGERASWAVNIGAWALGMDESGPALFVPKGYDGEFQYHSYTNGPKVIRDGDSKGGMIRFIGEKGEILVGRGDEFVTTPVGLKNLVLKSDDKRLYVSSDHRADWLNSIKTRQQTICNVRIGHRTATLCQLSGIAERLGRPVKWDPATEQIIGDPVASLMMDNPRRAPYSLPI